MRVKNIVCAEGRTGFFFDDQRAIKDGAVMDGEAYLGKPETAGFTAVRQAGESVSVMLTLDDGQIAHGDCAAVQYSGAGGRDPLFLAKEFIPVIERHINPFLIGVNMLSFRELTKALEEIRVNGKPLHTAIRYGISQAILDAIAKSKKKLMCEIVAEEYELEISTEIIPIFTQTGDSRYTNADKMILKVANILPHGLVNNVETKLGANGEKLMEYIAWLRDRVLMLRPDRNYSPVFHIDVYGTIGIVFGNENYPAIMDYLERLAEIARPFRLRIEGAVDAGGRERQMTALKELTALVDAKGIPVEIVADEWCNTLEDIRYFADNRAGHMIQIKTPDLGSIHNIVEAVLYCKEKGVGAYQGGTCNETDRSAQVCVHLAMAAKPDQILAKPGMGVDEGYMIVYNEMRRILALRAAKAVRK